MAHTIATAILDTLEMERLDALNLSAKSSTIPRNITFLTKNLGPVLLQMKNVDSMVDDWFHSKLLPNSVLLKKI